MELEEWIETKNLDQLEEEFKEQWGSSGYIIDEQFIEDYESEFADYLYAKYLEDNK